MIDREAAVLPGGEAGEGGERARGGGGRQPFSSSERRPCRGKGRVFRYTDGSAHPRYYGSGG